MTTGADRVRFSEDMASVTAEIVTAMLNSNMLSRETLVGSVRDIHAALIDVAMDSRQIEDSLDTMLGLPVAADLEQSEHQASLRSDAVRSQVSQLMGMSTAVFEPAAPPPVRVLAPVQQPVPPHPKPSIPIAVEMRDPEPAPAPSARRARDEQWAGEERRSRPVKAKRKDFLQAALPKRLSSVEEALAMDYITCLEDGKKVKDLAEHLARIGVTQEQYRKKWRLPREYPMQAPSMILKKADVYELDLVTGRIRATKS